MTLTLDRRWTTLCLLLPLACGGKIPLGEGETTGTDDGTDASSDSSDDSSDSTSTAVPDQTTGVDACLPIEDEPLGDAITISVHNALPTPILLLSPPMCDPTTHYLIQSPVDGSVSTVDQCFGYCTDLGAENLGCDAGCFGLASVLVQPGATAEIFPPWYGRLWQSQATPDACVAEFGEECFHGITVAGLELEASLWRRVLDESACADDGCTCPDGATSCEVDDQIEGTDADRFDTMFTFSAGTTELGFVIDG
jgi:hypothetical protein